MTRACVRIGRGRSRSCQIAQPDAPPFDVRLSKEDRNMPQDDDVTDLGEIVVTGQRRYDESYSFPSPPSPPPPIVDEIEPVDPSNEHPCGTAQGARDWNADAAAAEALRQMIDQAQTQFGEGDFVNREWGALLCESPDGSVSVGPIRWGDSILDEDGNMTNPGEQPTVSIPETDCGAARPIGMIHTHPGVGSGTLTPSQDDAAWIGYINSVRGDIHGRIYIVARSSSSDEYAIYIYDVRNSDSAENGQPGPQVNPDGQPCFSL